MILKILYYNKFDKSFVNNGNKFCEQLKLNGTCQWRKNNSTLMLNFSDTCQQRKDDEYEKDTKGYSWRFNCS